MTQHGPAAPGDAERVRGRVSGGGDGAGGSVRSGLTRCDPAQKHFHPSGTAAARTHHLEPPTRAATSAATARSLPPRPPRASPREGRGRVGPWGCGQAVADGGFLMKVVGFGSWPALSFPWLSYS